MSKLLEAFDTTLNTIREKITEKAEEKFQEIKKKHETKLLDKTFIKQRVALEAEEKKLQQKLNNNLNQQLETKRLIEKNEAQQPWDKLNKATQKVMSELYNLSGSRYNNGATIVDIATSQEMINTKEFNNYLQVNKLIRDTENIFGLTVSQKEQRNIILKIQSVDWQQFGIDLPYLDFMNPDFEIKVKDGEIITSTRVLLEGPSK